MADGMGIIGFLTAQYDRAQKLAEDACYYFTDGTWTASRGEGHFLHPDGPHIEVADAEPWRKSVNLGVWNCDDPADDCESIRSQWMAQAEFIAAHDPASVLADIAAKRQLLKVHAGAHICAGWDGESHWLDDEACLTACLLAAPYAGQPGYNPEWGIDA